MKRLVSYSLLLIILFPNIVSYANQKPSTIIPSDTLKEESIGEEGLVAVFYYKHSTDSQLPIILLGGSNGGLPINRELINKLVNSGYCVLATAYFKEKGLPETLTSVPLEFYDKAVCWLGNHPKIQKGKIAIIGTSKGGELALLLASRHSEVKVVVGIVPSAYVFQGIAPRLHFNSSWSYQGQDLPFVPYKFNATLFRAVQTSKFLEVYEQALENTAAAQKARIPVEKINGAVLLLSGKKDQMWPSTRMCDEIVYMFKKTNFGFPYEHIAYDFGHGVGKQQQAKEKIIKFLIMYYK